MTEETTGGKLYEQFKKKEEFCECEDKCPHCGKKKKPDIQSYPLKSFSYRYSIRHLGRG